MLIAVSMLIGGRGLSDLERMGKERILRLRPRLLRRQRLERKRS